MSPLAPRDRQVLRLLAFVLLPLFAVAYGVRPLVGDWSARRERLALQADLLAREREALTTAGHLDEWMTAALGATAEEERRVIRASALPVAASAFGDRLRELSRRDHVTVLQLSEAGSDSVDTDLRVLRVALRGESDLAGITRLLASIDADASRMRVTRLFIERQAPVAFGDRGGATDGRNVLVVHATVEALARIVPRGTASR